MKKYRPIFNEAYSAQKDFADKSNMIRIYISDAADHTDDEEIKERLIMVAVEVGGIDTNLTFGYDTSKQVRQSFNWVKEELQSILVEGEGSTDDPLFKRNISLALRLLGSIKMSTKAIGDRRNVRLGDHIIRPR